jgi:hypothetical protein
MRGLKELHEMSVQR